MNTKLWDNILAFDFDYPISEYGFSTRLAKQNEWSKFFTEQAVLEYKKFMYLAATSEVMVSPSEIVDIVWHQHLIFTNSYQNFCNLIGKQIQHIPSTHNKSEFAQFKQARENTLELYLKNFGKPPKEIWNSLTMFDSLDLKPLNFSINWLIGIALISLPLLGFALSVFLIPVYLKINNPYFFFGFFFLAFLSFAILEVSNRSLFRKMINQFNSSSLVFNLSPNELIYLKKQRISDVINGITNELVKTNRVKIHLDKRLERVENSLPKTLEEYQILDVFDSLGKVHYPLLLAHLKSKPIFNNVLKSMTNMVDYFTSSREFIRIFCFNFILVSSLLILLLIRLYTGSMLNKPTFYLIITIILYGIVSYHFLKRVTTMFFTHTLPRYYSNNILTTEKIDENPQWQYFLSGPAIMVTTLLPIITHAEQPNNQSNGCGSGGCGGGGCGGGGCGGGCGGCGS